MTQIVWSPQSLRDIQSIREYIAADSPAYADLVIRRLVKAVERLQKFPESGRIVPEHNTPAIREIIVPPYRIVYRLHTEDIQIVTVFRSSRLLTDFS